jgi:chromosome segregation and condensation protein ScpB
METGTAQNLVDALFVCKYRYEHNPNEFFKVANKYQMYLAQDAEQFSLEQLTNLMELYSHNRKFS